MPEMISDVCHLLTGLILGAKISKVLAYTLLYKIIFFVF